MSPRCSECPPLTAYSELIWEAHGQCTVQAGEVTLAAGDQEPWTPDLLLAAGVAASVMRTFLQLASRLGLTVLAYVSQQHVERSSDSHTSHIVVAPCVTVRTSEDVVLARALCDHAVAESPIVAMLSCRLQMEPRIVALPDEPIERGC